MQSLVWSNDNIPTLSDVKYKSLVSSLDDLLREENVTNHNQIYATIYRALGSGYLNSKKLYDAIITHSKRGNLTYVLAMSMRGRESYKFSELENDKKVESLTDFTVNGSDPRDLLSADLGEVARKSYLATIGVFSSTYPFAGGVSEGGKMQLRVIKGEAPAEGDDKCLFAQTAIEVFSLDALKKVIPSGDVQCKIEKNEYRHLLYTAVDVMNYTAYEYLLSQGFSVSYPLVNYIILRISSVLSMRYLYRELLMVHIERGGNLDSKQLKEIEDLTRADAFKKKMEKNIVDRLCSVGQGIVNPTFIAIGSVFNLPISSDTDINSACSALNKIKDTDETTLIKNMAEATAIQEKLDTVNYSQNQDGGGMFSFLSGRSKSATVDTNVKPYYDYVSYRDRDDNIIKIDRKEMRNELDASLPPTVIARIRERYYHPSYNVNVTDLAKMIRGKYNVNYMDTFMKSQIKILIRDYNENYPGENSLVTSTYNDLISDKDKYNSMIKSLTSGDRVYLAKNPQNDRIYHIVSALDDNRPETLASIYSFGSEHTRESIIQIIHAMI